MEDKKLTNDSTESVSTREAERVNDAEALTGKKTGRLRLWRAAAAAAGYDSQTVQPWI